MNTDEILIIGGGPSVNDVMDRITEEAYPNAIAVNNAWEIAPWAMCLFFGDMRWWGWNEEKVMREWGGAIETTAVHSRLPDRIKRWRLARGEPRRMLENDNTLFGVDSGTKSIALAWRKGAKKIVLAGFDLSAGPNGETHYHGGHERPTHKSDWDKFRGPQRDLIRFLEGRGIRFERLAKVNVDG